LKSMQSLSYKHIVHYLEGIHDLPATIQAIKRDTRHYAKRQMTWFGSDQEICWFNPDDRDSITKTVVSFLRSNGTRCFEGKDGDSEEIS